MPTVIRIDGLRVTIYPNDHRPAHVHVIGMDREAVFDLHCPEGPPQLRENYRFTRSALSRIVEGLANHLPTLCQQWKQLHGHHA